MVALLCVQQSDGVDVPSPNQFPTGDVDGALVAPPEER